MIARFEHDCDACRLFAADEQGDWYVCGGDDHRTVINRRSSVDFDYHSALIRVGNTELLISALLRGLVLTNGEVRRLLHIALTHERDLSTAVRRNAPHGVDDIIPALRTALLREP